MTRILLFTLIGLIVSCSPEKKAEKKTEKAESDTPLSAYVTRADLYTTTWHLSSYRIDGKRVKVDKDITVTLNVEEGTNAVTGTAACNNYFGGAIVTGREFRVSKMGSTRKLCSGEGVMELESIYLELLGSVNEITSGKSKSLTLRAVSGNELTFKPES